MFTASTDTEHVRKNILRWSLHSSADKKTRLIAKLFRFWPKTAAGANEFMIDGQLLLDIFIFILF